MADFGVRQLLLFNSCGGCIVAVIWLAGGAIVGLWLFSSYGPWPAR